MKELLQQKESSPPPALVHNQHQTVRDLFDRYVAPTYSRFDLVFSHGKGPCVWDVSGRRYLDFGGGIAVSSLGHCHPEIAETLAQQARQLVHVSNLYYSEPQGRLAQTIVSHAGPGRVFFGNSGAEANEGLFKLARKFGHEHPGPEGPRFEVLTTRQSFHGRTLAGISATGQDKVKAGFGPMVSGFRCDIPFNDLGAMESAVTPQTAAILIEGIQGEGGITPATPEYLLDLRKLCDTRNLLLMFDEVQCGHFRSGSYSSYRRILESIPGGGTFQADAFSTAKSLGGGFPISAFWIREKYRDLLGPGSHASTFGGTPLGCAVALKVFEVIQRENLMAHVRHLGEEILKGIDDLARTYPGVIRASRGMGFMIGLELAPADQIPAFAADSRPAALQFVERLHAAGVLTVPSGAQVIRLLPPLNLPASTAEEGLAIIAKTAASLS